MTEAATQSPINPAHLAMGKSQFPYNPVVEKFARHAYDDYSAAIGGVAFNGDPLPHSTEFFADDDKVTQADGWRTATAKQLVRVGAFDDYDLHAYLHNLQHDPRIMGILKEERKLNAKIHSLDLFLIDVKSGTVTQGAVPSASEVLRMTRQLALMREYRSTLIQRLAGHGVDPMPASYQLD